MKWFKILSVLVLALFIGVAASATVRIGPNATIGIRCTAPVVDGDGGELTDLGKIKLYVGDSPTLTLADLASMSLVAEFTPTATGRWADGNPQSFSVDKTGSDFEANKEVYFYALTEDRVPVSGGGPNKALSIASEGVIVDTTPPGQVSVITIVIVDGN